MDHPDDDALLEVPLRRDVERHLEGCTAASRYGNARNLNIDQVDRVNWNAIARSRWSRRARRSGRTGVTVIALRAFVAGTRSEGHTEHHEGRNADKTVSVSCHDFHPSLLSGRVTLTVIHFLLVTYFRGVANIPK